MFGRFALSLLTFPQVIHTVRNMATFSVVQRNNDSANSPPGGRVVC